MRHVPLVGSETRLIPVYNVYGRLVIYAISTHRLVRAKNVDDALGVDVNAIHVVTRRNVLAV